MKTQTIYLNRRIYNVGLRVTLAVAFVLIANTVLLAISAKTIKTWSLDKIQIMFLESSLITLFIALGIWVLRSRLDRGEPVAIGLNSLSKAILRFLLGFGLLLVPLLISLFVVNLAGWAEIQINWQSAKIDMILLGMLSVFITDAFPEELVFRGYIYSNLLKKFVKWKSALLTTMLFVLFPIILFPIKGLFGTEITTGLVNSVSASYLGYMVFFGAIAVYLRILTKSIWTGVGFHLMFVYMNQLIGLEDVNLVQFSTFTNELPVQLTFVILLMLTFIVLFAYPKLKGIKLGWLSHND